MIAIVLSAVLACAAALLIGQAILRLCGYERWSWLAAPVGLSVQLVVAVLCVHLPGRAVTTAVLLGALAVASAWSVLRDPAHRPPVGGLLAVAPVAALTLVPFAAAGRAGTLGVGFNNDMASHLLYADGYRSAAVSDITPIATDYPSAAHALVGTFAQALGADVSGVFSGITAATVILLGFTALGTVAGRVRWPARVLVATVGGMGFLVAGYYGQGAFKELMQALFVLGTAVAFLDRPGRAGLLRWVPLGFVVAGVLSVYGPLGLPWVAGAAGSAMAVALWRKTAADAPRAPAEAMRAMVLSVLVAGAALVVVIAPQLSVLADFMSRALSINGTGIPKTNLGNLAGPLPLWEAFGVWGSPDFRFGAIGDSQLRTSFVVALVVLGAAWSIRRKEWVLPLAVLAALSIWAVSNSGQSPYVAAKALVIMTPLLMVLAVRPLVERDVPAPRWWRVAAPVLGLVLGAAVVESSWQALRVMPVGPGDHRAELRTLRPLLDGKPTLFLGNDDFVVWELGGQRVAPVVVGFPALPLKDPKGWVPGQSIDIDTVEADAINASDFVIATRDAAASAMPPELEVVRRTRSFALWRRTGTVQPREVLPEGDAGAAILDCQKRSARTIVRGGGEALIRPQSTGVAVPTFLVGTSIGVELALAPGTYDLSTPYTSTQPIDVRVVGEFDTVLPANLDRPGQRWPIGRVTIPKGSKAPLRIGMYARRPRLAPGTLAVQPGSIVATPVGGQRTVPIRRACGNLVDWYRPAPPK